METLQDTEKEFFQGLKNIEDTFNDRLTHPITDYFEYRKHDGIPVCFIGEMQSDEKSKASNYLFTGKNDRFLLCS